MIPSLISRHLSVNVKHLASLYCTEQNVYRFGLADSESLNKQNLHWWTAQA
jgi:hypothetical protein